MALVEPLVFARYTETRLAATVIDRRGGAEVVALEGAFLPSCQFTTAGGMKRLCDSRWRVSRKGLVLATVESPHAIAALWASCESPIATHTN